MINIQYEMPDMETVIRYAVVNPDGVVVGTGYCTTLNELTGITPPGCRNEGLGDDEFPEPMGAFLKDGEFHPLPPQPAPYMSWNLAAEVWEDRRTPEQQQAAIALAWELLRFEREKRLAASDWTDTLSASQRLSKDVQDQWAAYRMALRDLPDNTVDPTNVEWPVPPTK